jgi:hypothetical protein
MESALTIDEIIFNKEIKKTNFIVKVYCILLIYRTFQIIIDYKYYQNSLILEEWLFVVLFNGLLLLIFFKPNWQSALLIALLQSKFDTYFACTTVGSNVTIFVYFYFASYYYCLSLYKKDQDKYKFNQEISNFKFLLALTWAILNLYSLVHHFNDSHWLNGTAFGVMLCNPYLSPHYQFFRDLFLNHNTSYLITTKIISYGFIILQLLMVPALLIKKGRILYFLFLFFYLIGITFFIDTSFLSHFAWLLFFLLLPIVEIKNKKIYFIKNPLKLSNHTPKINKVYFFIIGLFVILNTPYFDKVVKPVVWLMREWDTYDLTNRKLAIIGLKKVNLFNSYQIDGGGKWFVIYKGNDSNNLKFVPIMDTNGRKTNYHPDWLHTTNHGSDFIFLANTFQYAIGQERVNYSNSLTPYKMPGPVYERLIRFDFNKYSLQAEMTYQVHFYSINKYKNKANPFIKSLDSSINYKCTKTNLTKY